ncbi:hypothetical protein [Stenotrophomonas sp. SY1]|nr:hypothetical protein [Stenotrophomonas sp. SY1]
MFASIHLIRLLLSRANVALDHPRALALPLDRSILVSAMVHFSA